MVLGILVGLTSVAAFGLTYFSTVARANRAEAVLRQVENARLSYLIDHPVESYTDVTPAKISPFLPGGWDGAQALLDVNGYTIAESDLKGVVIGYGFKEQPTEGILPGLDAMGMPMVIKGFRCTLRCPEGLD